MSYYETNSDEFIQQTVNLDLGDIYKLFLENLPKNASILDIGCGSGRDLKFFSKMGHNPIGIEPSTKLAEYAKTHSGCKVINTVIQEFKPEQKFDGIWACASLLHLDTDDLVKVLNKIPDWLNKNGVFYCSFKTGNFKGIRNGRFFNDQTFESFQQLLPNSLEIVKSWSSNDVRPDKVTTWSNFLIKLKTLY